MVSIFFIRKVAFLLLVSISLIGCIKILNINSNSNEELKNNEEVSYILDFVEEKRSKLPIQVDYYTVWVDIDFVDNKLIYIYKISSSSLGGQQKEAMKNYYYSSPKKDEICKSIKGLLNSEITYEYKYVNMKGEELVVIPFDEKMCH